MANILSSLAKASDPKHAGVALLALNVFSTALAAATNTFAAATDKNTSAEDKKFLVPAGIATGVANVGLYLALTLKAIKGMEKVANNVIKNMALKGTLKENALNYANNAIKKAETKKLFKKSPEYIADMKSYLFRNGKLSKNAVAEYKDNIKGCASVAGALIGVVVGYGVLSPIIRDVSAYFVQKHMEKKNPSYKDKPYRPYFDPSHFKIGYAHTKQPLNLNSYMAFTRKTPAGQLKV
ncbi:MAG: hypothetical protein IJ877_06160 [Candidatus Gastranaerophilales bacterium]|nr:hypothetical protein [Candidatus Gastranaerophilales bacterium]